MNPLLYKEVHFQSVKYMINGQSTNINVFSWLLFFVKLRERERGWYIKFGYKGEMAQSYLSYFSTGFHWRIFLLSRPNRLYSIFLHWLEELGSLVSQIFFCLQPGILAMVRLPATNPAQKLTFLLSISADGGGAPLPFWGPSDSFGFSLPPLLVSDDLRLLSTNTCWYPLCDPHSLLTVTFLTGFHCSFQREDSINLTSIVSAGYRMTQCLLTYQISTKT